MLRTFFINLLIFILLLNFGARILLCETRAGAEECFEIHFEAIINASFEYAADYKSCVNNKNVKHIAVRNQKRTERDRIQEAVAAICTRFESCNILINNFDYFQCIKIVSLENMLDTLTIKFISTIALIDLDEELNQAEKDFMKCSVQAEHKYINATASAYLDFVLCTDT
ncbi:uncharacterized protein LOC119677684 [Teleopsis dalmanni]|uniref:uncharacterized protein LOC119677684 n=1 Tax=Teleopsis dalmanni TaxID=139649 RepID=UPI0018CDC219|nr:uncharacterized protein LOC119677684 [Teleopsis dalmanni]